MWKSHCHKFDLPVLWLTIGIVLLIATNSSSQTIQQLNEHNPTTHNLKIEQINRNLMRTKQNTLNTVANIGNKMNDDQIEPKPNDRPAEETTTINNADKPNSRKKRLIWITDDGRLALPPGTVLSITPTISLPLVRYPLEGFLSNMTMSFPLTIDFDKLGLTDNENPVGVLPPIFGARSIGRAAGSYLADYIGDYLSSRKARSVEEEADNFMTIASEKVPILPETQKHAFHGGERAILYGVVEDFLTTFGLDGKACVLRAICEIHSKKSLTNYGFFGEIAKLFFTATKSDYAHLMSEYVEAQHTGEGKIGPGECYPYYKKCPRSIFKNRRQFDKYSKDHVAENNKNFIDADDVENEISKHSRNPRMASSVFNM